MSHDSHQVPSKKSDPTPSVMKMSEYIITTCQKVQPWMLGMRVGR